MKKFGLSIKDFYCVFVRTEINLIAFSGPRNCVNTQYAALSGAMGHMSFYTTILHWQLVGRRKSSFLEDRTYLKSVAVSN